LVFSHLTTEKIIEGGAGMKKARVLFVFFLLMTFIVPLFTGCDESSHTKAEPEIESNTYPNAGLLVSGESLEASIGKPDTAIIDARSSGYSTSHIPGAISLLWSDYTDEGVNLRPVADLESRLSAAGLSRNMKFIIYDDTTASWSAAGRIFWMLEYLGCTDVHLLNGGWDKWVEDGRQTEADVNTLPGNTFGVVLQKDILSDKEHILSKLGDEDFVIIDFREDEEYNGWTLYGETRGGHIRDAVSVNYKWFFNSDKTVLSYEGLKDLLESRGITTDKEVVSYCTAGIRSGFVYFALRLMGYERCSNYDGSIYEWSADAACPMDILPNYKKLVYPAWVEELIARGNPGTAGSPPTYPGKGYAIVQVSDSVKGYNSGHIPSAINAFFSAFNGKDKSLLPDSQLQTAIENLGIANDTTVILYGTSAPAVGRFAWTLMYAGVEDVRVLNGGYDAWVGSGGREETIGNSPTPVSFGINVPGHSEYLATMTDVQKDVLDQDAVLADIRTLEEFMDGHIPGGTLMDWTDWLDSDGTFRSYAEVEQIWNDYGIRADNKVTFY
jgi:thiosulfate/3-mercaptopyruvate sulfurtransferase